MHLSICWIGLVELASARNRGAACVGRGVAMTDAYDGCDVEKKGFLDGRMRLWSYTAIMDAECQVKVGLFFLVNLWHGHDAAHNGLASSCLGISGKNRASNVDPDRAEHVDGSHPVKNGQM